jgi:hypothetical protein
MGFSCKRAGTLLAMAVCTTATHADPVTFDVSGFGTAALTYADTNKAEFVRDAQPTGADNTVSAAVDSLAGVQATVHFSSSLSATAQMVLRRVVSTDYQLDVPVAFVKDQLTDDLAVRVGRLPLPLFMVSDYREVGFANTFIRPPQEVYGAAPLYTTNGADFLYAHSFGLVQIDSQVYYGQTEIDVPSRGITSRGKREFGGTISVTLGPVTLHFGRAVERLTVVSPADQLIAALGAAGFTALASHLSPHDKPASFTGFGASLDWHNILLQGETTESKNGGFIGSNRGQYALAGYRIQKFTPYVMYSVHKVISSTTNTTIPAVGPLLPLALGVDALIAGYDQHSSSAGIRWDFHNSMDLKLQVDHISFQGPGLFANVQPGFHSPVNVVGLAVDFVF